MSGIFIKNNHYYFKNSKNSISHQVNDDSTSSPFPKSKESELLSTLNFFNSAKNIKLDPCLTLGVLIYL